jgi:hypothetical protein
VADQYVSTEVVIDVLRSCWIIESARARVYNDWAATDGNFAASAERAVRRAAIVERSLAERGREADSNLVEGHASWIHSLLVGGPEQTPLSDIFMTRIGDWVEAHGSIFLSSGTEEMKQLGDQDRALIDFPDSLPEPPEYEPVSGRDVRPPGRTRLRFGILGDLHVGSPRGESMARVAIADLNASGAEFVIQLGDITDHGDKDEFELAAGVLSDLALPYVTMMGNHDVLSRKENRLSGREYYVSFLGRDPDGVMLEHKGFRFAVLDSAEHGASPFGPFDLVTGAFVEGSGGAVVRGSLTPPQHDILATVAEPDGPPAFLFLHHPPQPYVAFPPVLFGLRDQDSGRLHATCESGNVWGVFAGHSHRNARTRVYGEVPVQEVGIPRDYPFGYALVDVSDSGYAYRFLQVSDEKLLQEVNHSAGEIQRRYARGNEEERAFVWRVPS